MDLGPTDHAETVAIYRATVIGPVAHRVLSHGQLATERRALSERRFRPPDAASAGTSRSPRSSPNNDRERAAESFFGTLKTELVDGERYPTRAIARASIGDYLENVYNPARRHSFLGRSARWNLNEVTDRRNCGRVRLSTGSGEAHRWRAYGLTRVFSVDFAFLTAQLG